MLHVFKLHNIRYSYRWIFHVHFKRDKITAQCTHRQTEAKQVSLEGVVGHLRPHVSRLYQSCMCISACTKRELMQVAQRYTLRHRRGGWSVTTASFTAVSELHVQLCISACTKREFMQLAQRYNLRHTGKAGQPRRVGWSVTTASFTTPVHLSCCKRHLPSLLLHLAYHHC